MQQHQNITLGVNIGVKFAEQEKRDELFSSGKTVDSLDITLNWNRKKTFFFNRNIHSNELFLYILHRVKKTKPTTQRNPFKIRIMMLKTRN